MYLVNSAFLWVLSFEKSWWSPVKYNFLLLCDFTMVKVIQTYVVEVQLSECWNISTITSIFVKEKHKLVLVHFMLKYRLPDCSFATVYFCFLIKSVMGKCEYIATKLLWSSWSRIFFCHYFCMLGPLKEQRLLENCSAQQRCVGLRKLSVV